MGTKVLALIAASALAQISGFLSESAKAIKWVLQKVFRSSNFNDLMVDMDISLQGMILPEEQVPSGVESFGLFAWTVQNIEAPEASV